MTHKHLLDVRFENEAIWLSLTFALMIKWIIQRQVFKPHLRTFNPLWQIFCDEKAKVDRHREGGGEHPFLLKKRLCGIDILLPSSFCQKLLLPEEMAVVLRIQAYVEPTVWTPWFLVMIIHSLSFTWRNPSPKIFMYKSHTLMVVRCGIDEFCWSNARWNLVRISDPQWVARIGAPD